MARADLILKLVKAGSSGDQAQFRKAAEALAADERSKQHTVLADRILGNLSINGNGRNRNEPLARGHGDTAMGALVIERIPSRGLDELILPPAVEAAVLELVEEQFAGRFVEVLQPRTAESSPTCGSSRQRQNFVGRSTCRCPERSSRHRPL